MSDLHDIVRQADYDRYLSALFAAAAARPHLMALYAFNHEIAKTAEAVSQPMVGLIRLQWWRDAIDEIYGGQARVREHEVAQALARTIVAHDLPRGLFEAMIEARESDLDETPFADMAALEAYADAASGHLIRLAARILKAGDTLDAAAGEAGIAYALTGLLRAIPFRAARRHLVLPLDKVRAAGLSAEDVFAGHPGLAPVIAAVAGQAKAHLQRARAAAIPRRFLPALLPAALCPPYLKAVTRAGFDPFRDAAEAALGVRQFAMLSAMLRGRL